MEARLFEVGTIPEWCTAEWYAERESAPHVDQGLHRPRLDMTALFVKQASIVWEYNTVADLGAGDGGLLWLLRDHFTVGHGYDLQQTNVDAAAKRGVDVRYGNFLTDEIEYAEIVVMTEVLEHLVDPHKFLRTLYQDQLGVKCLVASSPWSETLEDHYGYHTWAWDTQGYAAMLANAGWLVKTHETAGMFQVVMAIRP